ncbi:MAG TPA: DUF5906 domain-containing protein [Planctomycetota bacterium]|nr:DUF5906 domain-containing protein [Planctomycetota bacterium]
MSEPDLSLPSPDPAAAVEFLRILHPGRARTVHHREVGGRWVAKTFRPGEEAALLDWLRARGQSGNFYFSVNVAGVFDAKPSDADVTAVVYLHVDVDSRGGDPAERETILARIRACSPPPTAIVDSGGGYWGFWKLREAASRGADEEVWGRTVAAVKSRNRALALALGGDHCHDLSRVARLPGTVNRPDEKKRARGRVDALARLVEHHPDREYGLSQFEPAPEGGGAAGGAEAAGREASVELVDSPPRRESLDGLPIPDRARKVIEQGRDPDDPGRFCRRKSGERGCPPGCDHDHDPSRAALSAAVALAEARLTDVEIQGVLTDERWGVSRARAGSDRRELARTIAEARRIAEERRAETSPDGWVRRLNAEHATAYVGNKLRVLRTREEPVPGGKIRAEKTIFIAREDFAAKLANKRVRAGGKNGSDLVPVGRWWLDHPARRDYEGVVFAPGREEPGYFNLWRGFPHGRKEGDASRWEEFVLRRVAAGDARVAAYVHDWTAAMLQRPGEPGKTALVLRSGLTGTGKSAFADLVGLLLGHNYFVASQRAHLTGRFSGHLATTVLMHVCEAILRDETEAKMTLKALLTETTRVAEHKGLDAFGVSNCLHLIVTSNEEWVVNLDEDDRRFCVIEVLGEKMPKAEEYDPLRRWVEEEGGSGVVLDWYLRRDVLKFDPFRDRPKTKAYDAQKEASRENPWRDALSEAFRSDGGAIVAAEDVWRFLGVEKKDRDPQKGRRLTADMKSLGYERAERRLEKGGDQVKAFVRVGPDGKTPALFVAAVASRPGERERFEMRRTDWRPDADPAF